jgi:hypothetical protein
MASAGISETTKKKKKKKDTDKGVLITLGKLLAVAVSGAAIFGAYIGWDNNREDRRAKVSITLIKDVHLPPSLPFLAETLKRQGYIDIPYTYLFENTGKTPGERAQTSSIAYLSQSPRGALETPEAPPDGLKEIPVGIGLMTGYSDPAHPLRLTDQDTQEWRAGTKFVYVYVFIDYDDVYFASRRHHTWMCAKFDAWGKQTFCRGGKTD